MVNFNETYDFLRIQEQEVGLHLPAGSNFFQGALIANSNRNLENLQFSRGGGGGGGGSGPPVPSLDLCMSRQNGKQCDSLSESLGCV